MIKSPSELEASRRYNLKNKDKINELSRKYTKENKEKVLLNKKKYRDNHKEKLKEYGKKYYQRPEVKERYRQRSLRLKNEKEEKIKMFGNQNKKVKPLPMAEDTPDLVVAAIGSPDVKQHVGMPGFTEDAVQAPEIVAKPTPVPVAKLEPLPPAPEPVAKPTPVPVAKPEPVKEQYQIMGAEVLQDGLFRYVIITNKNIGEVGGVYET